MFISEFLPYFLVKISAKFITEHKPLPKGFIYKKLCPDILTGFRNFIYPCTDLKRPKIFF
jgi:hypothetical protein